MTLAVALSFVAALVILGVGIWLARDARTDKQNAVRDSLREVERARAQATAEVERARDACDRERLAWARERDGLVNRLALALERPLEPFKPMPPEDDRYDFDVVAAGDQLLHEPDEDDAL